MKIDMTEIYRSLAKAIAYRRCGDYDQAEMWARTLVEQLGCVGILTDLSPPIRVPGSLDV